MSRYFFKICLRAINFSAVRWDWWACGLVDVCLAGRAGLSYVCVCARGSYHIHTTARLLFVTSSRFLWTRKYVFLFFFVFCFCILFSFYSRAPYLSSTLCIHTYIYICDRWFAQRPHSRIISSQSIVRIDFGYVHHSERVSFETSQIVYLCDCVILYIYIYINFKLSWFEERTIGRVQTDEHTQQEVSEELMLPSFHAFSSVILRLTATFLKINIFFYSSYLTFSLSLSVRPNFDRTSEYL